MVFDVISYMRSILRARMVGVDFMNVLIIGNGLDLHLKMKTKYTDILNFIKNFKSVFMKDSYPRTISGMDTADKIKKQINNVDKFMILHLRRNLAWMDVIIIVGRKQHIVLRKLSRSRFMKQHNSFCRLSKWLDLGGYL